MRFKSLLVVLLIIFVGVTHASHCTGHFVNPTKDVCWRCLFPLSVGNSTVVDSALPDTPNAESLIGWCPTKTGNRLGLNIGFWEPQALVDVTDSPYCLVNLGGHQVNLGHLQSRGGRQNGEPGETSAFYHVHWYKYPLLAWLNLITSVGCVEGGDFDIAYLTELDPMWSDSEMSFVLNPEATLFANPIAQASCAADSLGSTLKSKPLDSLFWCAGAQGSHYPLTGHVNAPMSPVQTALLLAERLNYKLHRERLIADSSPKKDEICTEHYYPTVPKSRYRYEMVNQVADGRHCYPTGSSTLMWEAGKIKPHTAAQYGFLVWRKRNCTFTLAG